MNFSGAILLSSVRFWNEKTMLDHTEIRKGTRIIIDQEPYEVLEYLPLKKAQRRVVIQTKIRNLINGKVLERNFHQGDIFEEAEVIKLNSQFIYANREKYVFSQADDQSKRFELTEKQVGNAAKFLKSNEMVETLIFNEKIIGINLPIKINFKVIEAPPGIQGDRAQGGTKTIIIEGGTEINVPLFVKEGDVIEVNTESGEYVRRVE